MAITFTVSEVDFVLKNKQQIKKWISEVIHSRAKRVGEIGYLFCNDSTLLEANQAYLNHDTLTDIITFDYVEGQIISGDIMISIERVRENAEKFNVSFENELFRVIIHGIHHLLGQGDKTESEAAEMRRLENESLQLLRSNYPTLLQ